MTPQRPEPVHQPADAARIWQMYADEIGLPGAEATPTAEATPFEPEVAAPRPRRQRPAVSRSRRGALLAAGVAAIVVVLALRPEVRRLVAWPLHRPPATRAVPTDQVTTDVAKQSSMPADASPAAAPVPSKNADAPRLPVSPAPIPSPRTSQAPMPVTTTEPATTQTRNAAALDVRPASAEFPYRITFEFDSDRLSGDSIRTLQRILTAMQAHPEWRLRIEGHADAYGTPEHNMALSQRRAVAASDYLASAGIRQERLSVSGFGASRPLAGRSDQASLNRRVEFYRR